MERRRACYIGGSEFDPVALDAHLASLDRDVLVVTGNGRGAEQRVRRTAAAYGLELHIPELIDARRQVADVYVLALLGGLLVLVGEGFRVRQARKMLDRSSAWPLEVVEL